MINKPTVALRPSPIPSMVKAKIFSSLKEDA